ncbi:ROK family protein [Cohnella ginsengisoli]|uniref:ROK family protein n=1 Tax=Cohnella ginsengisoli TaxID=425004 RepID=A0A9X4KFD7_9BACL|nr:ROK family transcriptional regulator [Cohnella ginsengisoli]MDG0790569.1 ROK family protein [Cohnella ginsengisoli]
MTSFIQTHLKDMNRKTVFDLLSSVDTISRAEISRRTGISSPTVIKIVSYLQEKGFVIELGEGSISTAGRKPRLIRFNPDAAWSIGVIYEGDYLNVGFVDLNGDIKHLKSFKVAPNLDEMIGRRLPVILNAFIEEFGVSRQKILGVGIGIPGIVDPDTVQIEFAAPIVGVEGRRDCRDLIDRLSEQVGLPVSIDNDVKSAAWGEYITRGGEALQDLLYVSLGSGIGAGIILDGEIRRGKHSLAGEIAFTSFDPNFRMSKTEVGWIEGRVGIHPLIGKWSFLENILNDGQAGSYPTTHREPYEEMLHYIASQLALCISNLVAALDITDVVLGGVTVNVLGDALLDKVNEYLERLCVIEVRCTLQQSRDPGVVGVAAIATNHRLMEWLEG